MAEEKQEGQKTVVSFIVGLLIGGLLVWAFSGPEADTPDSKIDDKKEVKADKEKDDAKEDVKTNDDDEMTDDKDDKGIETTSVVERTLSVGDGKIDVKDQSASMDISLDSATYPVKEGWVGVRSYQDGKLGNILGVVRFSEEQGLVPDSIILQTPTISGQEYAVVVFEENGDRVFNLGEDRQIDTIFSTFTAK